MGASPSRRRPTGSLAKYAQASKRTGRLLPDVREFLLLRTEDRPQDVIHPSEISDPDYCPKAIALRLQGVRPPVEPNHFQLDNIFDEGHAIHDKWQGRWRDMGVLWGSWWCRFCDLRWVGMPPAKCPGCDIDSWAIKYDEVPLTGTRWRMSGHADGEIRDSSGSVMIELKSLGEGGLRIETPRLFAAHTIKGVNEAGEQITVIDHKRMFSQLRQPFLKHRRQGWIYLRLRELWYPDEPPVDGMNFVYEYKPTQAVREFLVKADKEQTDEIFAECADIVLAVQNDRLPPCRKGRKQECARCAPYVREVADGGTTRAETDARGDDPPSPSKRRRVVSGAPAPTGGRPAGAAARPERPQRPRTDRPADRDQSLGGLLRRAAGTR
jgi:hypothetical protein